MEYKRMELPPPVSCSPLQHTWDQLPPRGLGSASPVSLDSLPFRLFLSSCTQGYREKACRCGADATEAESRAPDSSLPIILLYVFRAAYAFQCFRVY